MSERELEVMAEQLGKLQWQVEMLEDRLGEQQFPLPTVPADATCGGCRWWRMDKYCNPNGDLGRCFVVPQTASRNVVDPACRHYLEATK